MLLQVDDCKNSWSWIIKHIFLISEKTLLNILDTFLCKIMKRELKCIYRLCAAILQDLEHPKDRPPISLSHTIECVWERRTSMFLVLDTNLWQPHMIIKHNQFSGQFWKMEGNNLISKAGMVFNSDDKWILIPLVKANLEAKFKILNVTCKFWLEICWFFLLNTHVKTEPMM